MFPATCCAPTRPANWRRARPASLAEAADEPALKTRLRQLRRREMVRIAWRDLAGWADLKETLATLSEFADACVDGALAKLHAWAVEKSGEPRGEHSGKPQQLVVLALGKLGGQELNFSSDIDLIFAYPEEGEIPRPAGAEQPRIFPAPRPVADQCAE